MLISNYKLVKTINYKSETYIGDPLNAIKVFNEKEVDEIIVLDINASRKKQEPNYDFIYTLAGECFMPLTYGGGISNLDQARQIFSLGVEKIALESSAIHDHKLIYDLTQKYGSQAITTSISVKKRIFSKNYNYSYSSSSAKKVDLINHVKKLIKLGVGEILLTSIDFEGTQTGLDLRLLKMIKEIVPVPLIIHGGVGKISDIRDGFLHGADAVGVGSYFVFSGPHRAVLISYLSKQDREFISTELGPYGTNL